VSGNPETRAGRRSVRAANLILLVFDTVTSARTLIGMSLGFHICFAAVGIGFPLLLLIAEGIALRTGDETYRRMAKRWARILAVLFAVGAVSGSIISFEFGLLWPTWMEFSGGVIGFPFALEGVAFFTEAIFLALYVYGWDRLSPLKHWLCAIPLVVSSAASALLVISVNGWMNHPDGFDVVDGKAVNIDPVDAMFNAAMPYEVVHGALASYVATGFAVAGVYAIAMLRGDRSQYVKKALVLGLAVGAVFAPIQVISGDLSARFVAHNQPEKLAAMEGQFETENGAPLRIGGFPDTEDKTTRYAIEIPKLASFLAFEDFDAEVRGLNSFPQDEIPDARIVHSAFQVMVGIGFFLLLVAVWFFGLAWWRKRIDPGRLLLLAVAVTPPLGFIAINLGWLVTEFGRQPWIIYHLMRTSGAATPREGIGFILLVFILVYISLTVGLALLLLRERRRATETGAPPGEAPDVA
jgi:cytochrome d ubiquinol oxidase subunit I